MVTIEQKLSLFSKLLQQDIANEMSEKIGKLEEEYEAKIKAHKQAVDLKAEEILEKSQKRAESKKIECLSKAHMQTKREYMKAKEKQVTRFMDALTKKIEQYVTTDSYTQYLAELVGECAEVSDEKNLVVYMTATDLQNHQETMRSAFEKIGVATNNMCFKEKDAAMLGGMIVENEKRTMRIDLSIASRIREHREKIVGRIFEVLGEVGE